MTGISGPAESKNPSVFCSVCVILHIRQVMDRLYSAAPDGYCGDEDNGQTSAWYVFSALGFYPVCPASDTYAIGAPYFPQMQINLENGKAIRILAENCVDGCGDGCREGCEEGKRLNCYIGEIRLNGTKYNSNFLSHSTLTEGATLHFTMCNPIHHHKPENHRPQCKS